MANTAYAYAKSLMATAAFNWTGSSFYLVLCSSSYVPNFATDSTYAAFSPYILAGGAAAVLSGLAVSSGGVLSANSVTCTGYTTGNVATWIVCYYNPSSPQYPVFACNVGTGLPYTTTGANITIDWNGASPSGPIFTL
jgi:hypothetical protein